MYQPIKPLKSFTGSTLETRRPRKGIVCPRMKSLKIAAGADARDIFALDSRIDFGVTSLKRFTGSNFRTSTASYEFPLFAHAGSGM